MTKRIIFFSAGIALIGFVVILGIAARDNSKLVLWFGLSCAILVPISFRLFFYTDHAILRKLSRVSELESLIQKAKTREEEIEILKKERENLKEVVYLESQKQALLLRKKSIENNGVITLKELEVIEKELSELNIRTESSFAREEIQKLHKRLKARQRGDYVIKVGRKYFTVDRDLVLYGPIGKLLIWCLERKKNRIA